MLLIGNFLKQWHICEFVTVTYVTFYVTFCELFSYLAEALKLNNDYHAAV